MKHLSLAALTAAALFAGTACSSSHHDEPANPPTVHVEPSSRDIVAGETVTLTARTRDANGRDAKIRWSAPAGSIKTEQDGRVARVKFTDPGTYTVRATLSVNGHDVQSDMVDVHVKPLG